VKVQQEAAAVFSVGAEAEVDIMFFFF